MTDSATARFARLAEAPESRLDLAEAALVIALEEYPGLDVARYLARIDEMARTVGERLEPGTDPVDVVRELNQYLFREQGFAGNSARYTDPRNSFLNEVLDRKLGIPISLSVLYIEIGRRLGLALEGVSFPGHFLVKLPYGEGEVVLDPFFGGLSLSEQDIEARLPAIFGEGAALLRSELSRLLAGVGKKAILARMLRNLKAIYIGAGEPAKALACVDRMLVLEPGDPAEVLDRAHLLRDLEWLQAAREAYLRYLELAPGAPDAARIRALAAELGRLN